MTEQQCVSCKDIESMYEQCSDCKLLISRTDINQEKTTKKHVTKQRKKKKQRILSALDILISVFVVTPLVISVWRGTWQLMDIYSHYFPPWESVIIGTMVHIFLTISQESFHDILIKKRSSWVLNAVFLLLMKSYTIAFNAVTNMHWRGAWMILDEYFGIIFVEPGETKVKYGRHAFAFFTIAFLIMFCLKSLRNLNSPPFEICLDYGDDMFLFPNMFKVKVSEKLSLYILDVIFSVGVVTNLGIIVWRGLWLLIDVYFFSYDQVVSSWASAFLGYIMVALVFLSQTIMKKFCDNLNGVPKLLVADTYIMFSVMAVILVWRGIWDLLNIYFLPDNPELSCWICHWIPMLLLILMGCSNSVLVRGVTADCEEPDGTCVVFPCNYLRVILDQEKKDTWTSIWHGKNKTDKQFKSKSISTSDHIVRINENKNHDTRNNNIT